MVSLVLLWFFLLLLIISYIILSTWNASPPSWCNRGRRFCFFFSGSADLQIKAAPGDHCCWVFSTPIGNNDTVLTHPRITLAPLKTAVAVNFFPGCVFSGHVSCGESQIP